MAPPIHAAQSVASHVTVSGNGTFVMPFVEDEHTLFMKTIIPSRKATKKYLGEESDDET
jgi:hypothetical protein